MPQLVVNKKIPVANIVYRNTKNNRFKLRHLLYYNRCVQTRNITAKPEKEVLEFTIKI